MHTAIKWGTNPCMGIHFRAFLFTVHATEMYHKLLKNKEKILAIAPMMDWTDKRGITNWPQWFVAISRVPSTNIDDASRASRTVG